MTTFDSAAIYIDSCTTIRAKITAIDAIIAALLTTAAKAAAKDNILEYNLDDGQTKIRSAYRSTAEVFQSINNFERLKQLYVNQLNGRVFRLVDGKSFKGRNNGF